MADKQRVHISAMFNPQLRDACDRAANLQGRSLSRWLEDAAREHLNHSPVGLQFTTALSKLRRAAVEDADLQRLTDAVEAERDVIIAAFARQKR